MQKKEGGRIHWKHRQYLGVDVVTYLGPSTNQGQIDDRLIALDVIIRTTPAYLTLMQWIRCVGGDDDDDHTSEEERVNRMLDLEVTTRHQTAPSLSRFILRGVLQLNNEYDYEPDNGSLS